ncbi:MAG TPA: amino acid adenylation domain-containing protein [Herpetosiphonaceae bacterium]
MSSIEEPSDQPELSPAKRALLEKWKRGEFARSHEADAIPLRSQQSDVPLSLAQQRLWFLDQLVPDSPAYNISFAVRLDGQLDPAALERSLHEIVRRHEVLRTTFAQNADGQPVQVIAPALSYPLPVEDLVGCPVPPPPDLIQDLVNQIAQRPFDLGQGPLFRAKLLRLSDRMHLFALSMHHIISDTWSMGVFVRELADLYNAYAQGASSPVGTPLPIQYADFAAWQRQSLQQAVLERQLAYWRAALADSPTVLDLPTDHPRPPIQTFHGAMRSFVVPADVTEALRQVSRQEEATLFMTLLAAFQTLLYRYSGQDDILVGSPIAGRTRPETERLIGFFVNTLVLRGDLSGQPAFRELLRRVRETTLGAYANQDLPFEQMVDLLQPERDMSRNPLFQVMFVLQNTPMPALQLPTLSMSMVPASSGTAKFDLWLSVTEADDTLLAVLEYNTDLFEAATIERLIGHFQTLLPGIAADPRLPITRLPLLSDAERQQLSAWNRTRVPYPPDRTLHELVEAQAEATPDAAALIFGDTSLSYRELNQRANQLAHHLRALGVGNETPVGVCVERSLELVIALLAILKAGGAYVPLDPGYPAERLAFLIKDSQVPVLLTQQHLDARLPDHQAAVLHVAAAADQIARWPTTNPVGTSDPDRLAYIIYTSGSTGQPKGAMNSHGAIVNRLLWMQDAYRLTPADAVLQKTPFSFDVSVWEFFWPLIAGARLVVAVPEGHKDPAYLAALIAEQQITTLHFVPSMLQAFLDEPEIARCRSLRRVICSGEALSLELQQRCFAGLDAELHNLYGPTEAAVDVTAWACERDSARRAVPIGRPIANTQIYLLDAYLEPVPVGIPGELYIGGVQLARGYWQRPDLTAERFIPDPFSSIPGARLYRTGDLARYASDGAIEYLGRIDQQVKLRGFRIELGEIAATLRQHPAVREAIATVREDANGHRRLAVYVVPEQNQERASSGHAKNQDAEPDGSRFRVPSGRLGSMVAEQVQTWQQVFDTAYAETRPDADPTFNIVGWNSSFTGEPLPATAMREWVDQTVARVRSLRPRRILEIGCGTGLLLHRLAPDCACYIGTDISAVALETLSQQVAARGLTQVALHQRPADDLDGLADSAFDVVILNSVVQYFPGVEYLVGVLENAARVVAPGGHIFVGDVRSLPLLEAFHAAVQLFQANDDLPTAQLRQRVQRALLQEQELALDPAFFTALMREIPRIGHVAMQLKRGHDHNELTRFRYDVTLSIDTSPHATAEQPGRDWRQAQMTLTALRQELREHAPLSLRIVNVPDARLRDEIRALRLLDSPTPPAAVGELRAALADRPAEQGVDPEAFWALEDELPYTVSIFWSGTGTDGCYDVLLRHTAQQADVAVALPDEAASGERAAWSGYANNPLQARLTRQLTPILRGYLQEHLPDYMVPTTFVLLERLPLLPNGKIDRQALPPLPLLELETESVAPRTAVEHALAHIWRHVLNVERIGIHHNFFALGGDSILSLQIIARAKQAGLQITTKQIFQHQTIAELAGVAVPLTSTGAQHADGPALPQAEGTAPADGPLIRLSQQQLDQLRATRGEIEDLYPLAPVQEHMLRRYLAAPEPGLYLVYGILFLQPVNLPAFRRAWQQVVNRQAVLRTSFVWEGVDQPFQVVHKQVHLPIEQYDWRGLSPDEHQERLAAYIESIRQQGFDLTQAPHTRMALFQVSEEAYQFFWGFNFMLQDGWSFPLVMKDFFDCYDAACAGREMPQSVPQPYRSYIAHLHRLDLTEAERFWRKTLKGFRAPTPLAARAPGNRPCGGNGFVQRHVRLSVATTKALQALAQQQQLTLNTLVQGAWAVLMARYTSAQEVLFGSTVAGRSVDLPGIEAMIGSFNNFLPTRVRLSPDTPLLTWLRELQLQQVEQRQYEYTPLVKIKAWSDVPADQALFETYLTFENFPVEAAILERSATWMEHVASETQTEHALRVTVWPFRSLSIYISYYERCFDDATIRRMLKHFEQLLEGMAGNPHQRLGALASLIEF